MSSCVQFPTVLPSQPDFRLGADAKPAKDRDSATAARVPVAGSAPKRLLAAIGLRRKTQPIRFVHVRIDSLLAAAEQARNGALNGKAVVVAREAVLAATYEARWRGVREGMSVGGNSQEVRGSL